MLSPGNLYSDAVSSRSLLKNSQGRRNRALALTLIFNHLTNELLQATTMFYGLMYLTCGSATEHNKVRDGL